MHEHPKPIPIRLEREWAHLPHHPEQDWVAWRKMVVKVGLFGGPTRMFSWVEL